MFEKTSVRRRPAGGRQVHDDCFLRPANTAIGRRLHQLGDRCLARFLAQVRHGPRRSTPSPASSTSCPISSASSSATACRRAAASACSATATSRRTSTRWRELIPTKISGSALGLRSSATPSPPRRRAAVRRRPAPRGRGRCRPAPRSSVGRRLQGKRDIFVDEEFANVRAGRESKLGQLLWKPTVRCSTHYRFTRDEDGPRIVRVGIGADDRSEGLALFARRHRTGAPGAGR